MRVKRMRKQRKRWRSWRQRLGKYMTLREGSLMTGKERQLISRSVPG